MCCRVPCYSLPGAGWRHIGIGVIPPGRGAQPGKVACPHFVPIFHSRFGTSFGSACYLYDGDWLSKLARSSEDFERLGDISLAVALGAGFYLDANGDGEEEGEKAKDRRERQRREAREAKHGDDEWQEPASEDYVKKHKAKKLEKVKGKDARQEDHCKKLPGE